MIRMPERRYGHFPLLVDDLRMTTRSTAETPQDNIGMHQDVSRLPWMGIRTLSPWRLADGVYRSLFLSRMSAYRLGIFMITLRCPGGKY